MGTALDKFDNWAVLGCPFEAAASGLNHSTLVTGITNNQKVAWDVRSLWVYLTGTAQTLMNAAGGHFIDWALSATPTEAALSMMQSTCYYMGELHNKLAVAGGAGGGASHWVWPLRIDIGSMLVLPQQIHLLLGWDLSAAAAATDALIVRMNYREVELTSADWYDLLQLRLPLGAL